MNELQKKLARRRCLNGEDGAASSNIAADSFTPNITNDNAKEILKLETRKSANFLKGEPSTSTSVTDELQKKLARQRTANGEAVFDNGTDTEIISDVSPVFSLSKSIDFVESNPSRSTNPSKDPSLPETKVESVLVLPEGIKENRVSSKSLDHQEESISFAVVVNISEENRHPVVEKKELISANDEVLLSSSDERQSIVSCAISSSPVTDPSHGETSTSFVSENPTKDIFKSAEEMLNMIDQELDSFQLHSTGHSLLQQGFARAKKPSSDIFDEDETNFFANNADPYVPPKSLPLVTDSELRTVEEPEKGEPANLIAQFDSTIADTLSVDDDDPNEEEDDTHHETDDGFHGKVKEHLLAAAQTSLTRAIRSTSHGSTCASSKDMISMEPQHASAPPPSVSTPASHDLFPIPSTGSTSEEMSPKPSSSSLKKVASGYTSPKANNVTTTPMSPDKWYPGKYLLGVGGRWGGSRHKIDMNKEQAQSLYNDLIASGDKPAVTSGSLKSRQGSITENSMSAKIVSKVNVTAGTTDSSSLLAENHRLKQEILRLQCLLEEKQAVIDAYELSESLRTSGLSSRKNIEISSNALTSGDGNNNNNNNNNTLGNEPVGHRSVQLTRKFVGFESVMGMKEIDLVVNEKGFGEHDDGRDSGFEAGDGLFFGHHHQHHRLTIAGSRGISSKTNFDALLDSPSALARGGSDNHKYTVHPDDGLSALLQSDKEGGQSGNIVHFNPRAVGREEDLVRSFNFAASSGRSAPTSVNSGMNDHSEEGGETGDDESGEEDPVALSYEAFLQLFAKSADLQFITKSFILSVLGPNGDATPPVRMVKLDYVFYGTHKLDERCRQFFEEIDHRLKQDPCFRLLNDEQLICAHDGIEQYVMHRIGQHAYKLTETVEEDQLLMRRMKMLSNFLTPDHLEIPPDFFQEDMLLQAGLELKAINNFRTPGDKVACIVRCVTIIFRSLSVARKRQEHALYLQQQEKLVGSSSDETASSPNESDKMTLIEEKRKTKEDEEEEEKPKLALAGADDFLPLFIWVVLQSKIPRLVSNAEYIHMYLNSKRLMGKSGYCLINLRSAIDFVTYVEASSLKIDPEYFASKLQLAESRLKMDDI